MIVGPESGPVARCVRETDRFRHMAIKKCRQIIMFKMTPSGKMDEPIREVAKTGLLKDRL
jgi:hypothetical protein